MKPRRKRSFWQKLRDRFDDQRPAKSFPPRARPAVEVLEDRLTPSNASAGELGIDSRNLQLGGSPVLTGQGVTIGQFEGNRPAKDPPERLGDRRIHPDVTPTEVFVEGGPAGRGEEIDNHPLAVAGVMIGTRADTLGVSPDARLFSGAIKTIARQQEQYAVVAQTVALADNSATVAMNFSAGAPLEPGRRLDGNNLLTAFIDWSAEKHETLYVTAGNQFKGLGPVPTDEHNGVTVAFSEINGSGKFTNVHLTDNRIDQDAVGLRRSVDLVAPGRGIRAPSIKAGVATYGNFQGTSFAAPHVTGTVALLQQFANNRIAAGADGWTTGNAKRHEVIKAVLLNSADKIDHLTDSGSLLIDMDRDVYYTGLGTRRTFVQSDAADHKDNPGGRKLPLDLRIGAGQVNARRALKQYGSFGEQDPTALFGDPVQPIGWDYQHSAGQGNANVYRLPLVKGLTYVTLTLAWDRIVTLSDDDNGNGQYDPGDGFDISRRPANLDLYLMPPGGTDPEKQSLWSSVSADDNLEHIFFKVPEAGKQYEIWVVQKGADAADYALAWWVAPGAIPPPPPAGGIAGTAWEDVDRTGIRSVVEPGAAFVCVDLYDTAGKWIDTTTTDAVGDYAFTGVSPGQYVVTFTAPEDRGFTVRDAGLSDSADSDVGPDGNTLPITVSSSDVADVDAGLVLVPFGRVGGRAWYDDGDGSREAGELGIPDTVVYLYRAGGGLEDVTATDVTGSYVFPAVRPGEYYLQFEETARYHFAPPNQGSDLLDSDVGADLRIAGVVVDVGEVDLTLDAGLVADPTVVTGISGVAWRDDGDGIRESGEAVLAGVPVMLFTDYDDLVGKTVTDSAGGYSFSNFPPGDYYVIFGKPGDGAYTFAAKDQGADTTDSDCDAQGETDLLSVANGQLRTSVDAGLVPDTGTGMITVYAWHDMDHDGLQDMGEPGIGPVGVALKTAGGVVVSSGTTTSAGVYEFTGVASGSYYLVFSIPLGSSFTLQDQGTNDTVDSDVNSSGQTALFTLAAGQHRTDLDAGAVGGSMAPSGGSGLPLADEVFRLLVPTPLDEMVAALALVAAAAVAPPELTNDESQSPDFPALESFDQAGTAALADLPGMPAPLLLASERRSAVDDVFDILFSDPFLRLPDNPLEVL